MNEKISPDHDFYTIIIKNTKNEQNNCKKCSLIPGSMV